MNELIVLRAQGNPDRLGQQISRKTVSQGSITQSWCVNDGNCEGCGRGVGNATSGIQSKNLLWDIYTLTEIHFCGYSIEVPGTPLGNNEPFLAHNLCPLHTKDEFYQQKVDCCSSVPGVILLIHYP